MVKHGKAGIGATRGSSSVSLKWLINFININQSI